MYQNKNIFKLSSFSYEQFQFNIYTHPEHNSYHIQSFQHIPIPELIEEIYTNNINNHIIDLQSYTSISKYGIAKLNAFHYFIRSIKLHNYNKQLS